MLQEAQCWPSKPICALPSLLRTGGINGHACVLPLEKVDQEKVAQEIWEREKQLGIYLQIPLLRGHHE